MCPQDYQTVVSKLHCAELTRELTPRTLEQVLGEQQVDKRTIRIFASLLRTKDTEIHDQQCQIAAQYTKIRQLSNEKVINSIQSSKTGDES